jgi:hypothetical protein
MMNSQNKKWLIAIAVILVGILAVMVIGLPQKTDGEKIGDSISDVIDSAGDNAKEFREEVQDEIDDNTKDTR